MFLQYQVPFFSVWNQEIIYKLPYGVTKSAVGIVVVRTVPALSPSRLSKGQAVQCELIVSKVLRGHRLGGGGSGQRGGRRRGGSSSSAVEGTNA